jgi:RNA binding exosome subunit
MAKGPIQSVEVSYFVHSTEDAWRLGERVREALEIQCEQPQKQQEEESRLEGHFGNVILHVRYHLLGADAERVVERLASRLVPASKRDLSENLEKSLDEHSALYLRLDKQSLVEDRFEFSTADPVRLKVKPRLFIVKGGAPAFYRSVMHLDD